MLRSAARLLPSPSRRLGRCAIVFGLRGSPRRCGRRRSLFCYGRSRRQLRPVFLPHAPRWCVRRRCCAWYRGPSGCSGCSRWLGAERSTIFHRAAAGLATSLRRRACQSRLQRVRAVSSSIGSIRRVHRGTERALAEVPELQRTEGPFGPSRAAAPVASHLPSVRSCRVRAGRLARAPCWLASQLVGYSRTWPLQT